MSRVLLLYASSYGHTCAIANVVADRLREYGHMSELIDAGAPWPPPPPIRFDAIILGSPVVYGRHARAVVQYVRRHRPLLRDQPTGFFSVGLDQRPGRAELHLARFARATGWRPWRSAAFAGGLAYPQYSRIVRLAMRQLSRWSDRSTDTSQNHVYTDWNAVLEFADQFASDLADAATVTEERLLPAPAPEPSAAGTAPP
jgi:menaquinone-dependent protoporphyrinogen oxidase